MLCLNIGISFFDLGGIKLLEAVDLKIIIKVLQMLWIMLVTYAKVISFDTRSNIVCSKQLGCDQNVRFAMIPPADFYTARSDKPIARQVKHFAGQAKYLITCLEKCINYREM